MSKNRSRQKRVNRPKSFKGDYFADPKWLAKAMQIIRDDIEQYPPEMRAALYGVYNIPPKVIE